MSLPLYCLGSVARLGTQRIPLQQDTFSSRIANGLVLRLIEGVTELLLS
jgi:hypothetical protein